MNQMLTNPITYGLFIQFPTDPRYRGSEIYVLMFPSELKLLISEEVFQMIYSFVCCRLFLVYCGALCKYDIFAEPQHI